MTKKVTFTEAVEHLTQLNNALYHIGALRPDIKDSIDDHLNQRAMKEAVEEIDKELASDDVEIPSPPKTSESDEVRESEPSSKDVAKEEEDFLDDILHASVETPDISEDESQDPEMNITGSDVVTAETRKQKKRVKETLQLSLLDEVELAESAGGSEEERDSASV